MASSYFDTNHNSRSDQVLSLFLKDEITLGKILTKIFRSFFGSDEFFRSISFISCDGHVTIFYFQISCDIRVTSDVTCDEIFA